MMCYHSVYAQIIEGSHAQTMTWTIFLTNSATCFLRFIEVYVEVAIYLQKPHKLNILERCQ